jgi:hypothetical protein
MSHKTSRKSASGRPGKTEGKVPSHTPTRGLYGWITHTEFSTTDPAATKAWCTKVLGSTFKPIFPTPAASTIYLHLSHACPAAPEAVPVPAAQSAPGLVSQPAPRHFDGDRSDMPASGFADPLLSALVPALVGRRDEARGRAHLLSIPELPPAEEFMHVHPRPVRADRPETQQLTHLLNRLAAAMGDRPSSLALQPDDLPVQKLRMLPLPL